MPFPNTNYVASVPLQYYFVDKDTGAPLSAGVVSFFSDPDFTIPKNVYEQSLNPVTGEIAYEVLPNPLILSSVGTFIDDSGNNLTPFYWPFTSAPGSMDVSTEELYFITVYSSTGVFQFSLNEWPPNTEASAIFQAANALTPNVLTNPDFSVVSFAPVTGVTYTVSGAGTLTPFAPGWSLLTTGSGTVTVSQVSLAQDTPSNAPFDITITSTAVTNLAIVQQLTMSPNLLNGSVVAGYFEMASNYAASVSMNYVRSNGAPLSFPIVMGVSNATNNFQSFTATVPITGSNTDAGAVGYVNVVLTINNPNIGQISLTSVQLLQVAEMTDTPPNFIQSSTQEQLSQLFWFYSPKLAYKPIPSYLTGWDFPLNPTQFSTTTTPGTGGPVTTTNGSNYIWDQTILFSSVDNVTTWARNTGTRGLSITTSSTTTSFAIVQYLSQEQAREILSQRDAVEINAFLSTGAGNIAGYVSLYWTTASLPAINSGYSLVSAIDATTAIPSVGTGSYGTWTQVKNTLNNGAFTIAPLGAGVQNIFDFAGFDATSGSGKTTATSFAIVVSFAPITSSQTVTINYCSLVGGDIPTRPAPQAPDEVLRECQRYYETSYPFNVLPGTASSVNGQVIYPMSSVSFNTNTGPVTYNWASCSAPFTIPLKSTKRVNTYTPVFYAPVAGTAANFTYTKYTPTVTNSSIAASNWVPVNGYDDIAMTITTSVNLGSVTGITSASNAVALSGSVALQYVIDARLGVI